MNTVAYFEIQAAQPDSVIAFYREVFGWQFTRAEGLPIPYWRIDTGGIRGGLLVLGRGSSGIFRAGFVREILGQQND